MRLLIDDFAKIKHADMIVDGITVIAGENNTGKSTVGKILFSLFNAISGIEDKIIRQREKEINNSVQSILRNYASHNGLIKSSLTNYISRTGRMITRRIVRILEAGEDIGLEGVYFIVKKEMDLVFSDDKAEVFQEKLDDISYEIALKIQEILDLSDHIIMLEVLSRYFSNVFYDQVNSLLHRDAKASLHLKIKDKNIDLVFENSRCIEFKSEISLLNKAIYMDNPFIIDRLDCWDELNVMEQFLKDLLTGASGKEIMDGVIESVLAKEKMSELEQALQSVVDGRIVVKKEDEFYLEKEGFSHPVSFHNLSTGLKSFVVIKMLVEKGLIKEKDVLILDEPEIHLHPQWQVAYAELIVLLQKYFDLSIIVTTHSPYFMDAINLFSVKHGLGHKVNYYLSSIEENRVNMTCVNSNLDLIYQKMASPIQMLDTLRHELNYH